MATKGPVFCNKCNPPVQFGSEYHRQKHNIQVHGWIPKSRRPVDSASPLDIIHEHERGIRKALQTLETERDQLHARIVEIDNLCAKYKKFEATTGNGH